MFQLTCLGGVRRDHSRQLPIFFKQAFWLEVHTTLNLCYELFPLLGVPEEPSKPSTGFALGVISSPKPLLSLSIAWLHGFQELLPAPLAIWGRR